MSRRRGLIALTLGLTSVSCLMPTRGLRRNIISLFPRDNSCGASGGGGAAANDQGATSGQTSPWDPAAAAAAATAATNPATAIANAQNRILSRFQEAVEKARANGSTKTKRFRFHSKAESKTEASVFGTNATLTEYMGLPIDRYNVLDERFVTFTDDGFRMELPLGSVLNGLDDVSIVCDLRVEHDPVRLRNTIVASHLAVRVDADAVARDEGKLAQDREVLAALNRKLRHNHGVEEGGACSDDEVASAAAAAAATTTTTADPSLAVPGSRLESSSGPSSATAATPSYSVCSPPLPLPPPSLLLSPDVKAGKGNEVPQQTTALERKGGDEEMSECDGVDDKDRRNSNVAAAITPENPANILPLTTALARSTAPSPLWPGGSRPRAKTDTKMDIAPSTGLELQRSGRGEGAFEVPEDPVKSVKGFGTDQREQDMEQLEATMAQKSDDEVEEVVSAVSRSLARMLAMANIEAKGDAVLYWSEEPAGGIGGIGMKQVQVFLAGAGAKKKVSSTGGASRSRSPPGGGPEDSTVNDDDDEKADERQPLRCRVDGQLEFTAQGALAYLPSPVVNRVGNLLGKAFLSAILPNFLRLLAKDFERWAMGEERDSRGSLLGDGVDTVNENGLGEQTISGVEGPAGN